MINVFADRYLHNIKSYLPSEINLNLFEPANGLPDLRSAHALLIRTVSPINKQTLPNIPTKLQFVGTASAGTDHIDINYLQKNNIIFSDAAGCNARSVAEYVGTALLLWAESRNTETTRLSTGIIGAGQVGTKVIELANKLDIPTVAYDPPREEREPGFTSASVEEVLNCDILSFHTPLTTEGLHPTFHWLNTDKLATKNFQLIINTSRGGVINEAALLQAKNENIVSDFIIDVWENEPAFDDEVARAAFIATPHIAGYSIQAKFRATKMIIDQMIGYFSLDLPLTSRDEEKEKVNLSDCEALSLTDILTAIHPIEKYDCKLRKLIGTNALHKKQQFNQLRTSMPFRNEFAFLKLPGILTRIFPILDKLGVDS
jgi:erythronate-4-phosphate dehydrogenase